MFPVAAAYGQEIRSIRISAAGIVVIYSENQTLWVLSTVVRLPDGFVLPEGEQHE